MIEQKQAEDHLRQESLYTHYLNDWNQPERQHKKCHLKKVHRFLEGISEEEEQNNIKHTQRRKSLGKLSSLSKYDKKSIVNQISFPVLCNHATSVDQQNFVKQKCQLDFAKDHKSLIRAEKQQLKQNIFKVIEAEFLKAKADHFKKKHEIEQAELNKRLFHNKLRNYLKPTLKMKSHLKCQLQSGKQKQFVNPQEIQQIKRIISNRRRYSMAHLGRYQTD